MATYLQRFSALESAVARLQTGQGAQTRPSAIATTATHGYRCYPDRIERLDFATGAVTRCMTADPAAWANRAALVYT